MKKETAIKRIRKVIEKTCKGESEKVKDYFCNLIYLIYRSLELDNDEFEHTITDNLKFAIAVNLEDLYFQLLQEVSKNE